jgi:predicted aspartyl protease
MKPFRGDTLWAGLVLASLFLGTAAAAPEGAVPDSSTIYAKVRAADGIAPANYREVIQAVQSNGGTLVETRFVLGENYRSDAVTGTVETQTGKYKGDSWHQNANGLTVVHELPPGLATPDTFTTTVTAIDEPVTGYRIARLNVRGYGAVDYVNSKTWQIVRSESIGANGTSTTVYGARFAFGDVRAPKTWHVHNVSSGLDIDYTREAYEAGTVTDADVAIPPNRRRLVEFPPGVDSVALPTVFARSNHMYVRLMVEGRGYDFLLDSGASGITVDPSAVAQMHLKTFDQMENSANAGRIDTATARIDTLSIGPLTMHDVIVSEVPMTENEADVKGVGLLGFDFLAELGVAIDYDHKTVTVHRYGTYSLPSDKTTNVIPIRLDTQQPSVTAKINGALAERIVLDTGGFGPFLLFDYFTRRHPEALVDKNAMGLRVRPMQLRGVGGIIGTRAYDLPEIDLGSVRYVDFIGWVVTSKSYGGNQDGLFGPDFLKVYDVFFDYPNGQVALTLNATGRRAAGH